MATDDMGSRKADPNDPENMERVAKAFADVRERMYQLDASVARLAEALTRIGARVPEEEEAPRGEQFSGAGLGQILSQVGQMFGNDLSQAFSSFAEMAREKSAKGADADVDEEDADDVDDDEYEDDDEYDSEAEDMDEGKASQ